MKHNPKSDYITKYGKEYHYMFMLSNEILKARKSKGLTQLQLAEMIGKTENMISRYERGSSIPPREVLKTLGLLLKGDAYFFRENNIHDLE